MEDIKYYKVKFTDGKTHRLWLGNCCYDYNSHFVPVVEKQAMYYSSILFNGENRLTDYLKDREYDLVEPSQDELKKVSRLVDGFDW